MTIWHEANGASKLSHDASLRSETAILLSSMLGLISAGTSWKSAGALDMHDTP